VGVGGIGGRQRRNREMALTQFMHRNLPSRDGICSIIYFIIMGIELYNNNRESIIIFLLCIRGYVENFA
jgi:hypothetical protein